MNGYVTHFCSAFKLDQKKADTHSHKQHNRNNTILNNTMNYLAALLAVSALFAPCSGQEFIENLHHYGALEWDVESPQDNPCATERGFFGRSAKYGETFRFTYEVELLEGEYLNEAMVDTRNGLIGLDGQPPAGLRGVFGAIETRIADAILTSEVFDSVCAGGIARGPFRSDGGGRRLRNTHREMRAVGISSAPDDMILEGCKYSTELVKMYASLQFCKKKNAAHVGFY